MSELPAPPRLLDRLSIADSVSHPIGRISPRHLLQYPARLHLVVFEAVLVNPPARSTVHASVFISTFGREDKTQ